MKNATKEITVIDIYNLSVIDSFTIDCDAKTSEIKAAIEAKIGNKKDYAWESIDYTYCYELINQRLGTPEKKAISLFPVSVNAERPRENENE